MDANSRVDLSNALKVSRGYGKKGRNFFQFVIIQVVLPVGSQSMYVMFLRFMLLQVDFKHPLVVNIISSFLFL